MTFPLLEIYQIRIELPDESIDNVKILLLKVADGDENAFSKLFETYYNQLGDFIKRIAESELLTKGKVILGPFRKCCKGAGVCCHDYFCIGALVKQKLKTPLTQYQILQILSLTLLNKTPLNQLFQEALIQYVKESEYIQLKMF